jgi:WD40 repeat protein/serine/threonine protein kinase
MSRSREDILVARAMEKPAGERASFLELECAGDRALRRRVEALLAAEERQHKSPGGESTGPVSAFVADVTLTEGPGATIGRYKLLEKLGEGGFGAVWAADQREPVKRRVALKIIKLGMDTQQVVARFEAERQALAMMDHPNIAKVLDAGATQLGRPYFVMELVKGIPITRYCDQEKLPTADRLDLFIKVCHAIQHAHQKGIIHRDIKPSNIMVTLHDGVPVPKVIDFGIAKATQAELTEKTIYTQYGQFIGTPAYMSPEQAEMSGLDIDTRSDIYSLGVLLYEMLTGSTPFDTEELLRSGLDAMRRIIREREPLRPSTRLRRTSSAASSFGAPPLVRPSSLASDLDWIVMKCLEKDRTRRYETANALAMDLLRHIKDEPVTARPPSAAYKLQKAWRRNKVAYTACASVMIALAMGVAGMSIGLFRAAKEQARATRAAEAAMQAAHEAQEARALAESNAAMLETNLYFSRVALAHREHTARPAGIRLAEKLLDDCSPRLRHWEWHHLKRRRFAEPLALEDPESGVSRSVAFSPDNRHLASGGSDGKVRIWDLTGPRLAQALPSHSDFVASVAFSPTNPRWIASLGADAVLRLWDWQSVREVRSWPAGVTREYGAAHAVTFSPDGELLAAPGEEGEVSVRSTKNGEEVSILPGHERGVQCVAFSPDARWIATGSSGGAVRLWEASSGRALATLSSGTPPIGGVAFTRDSEQLVALQFNGVVRIWNPSRRSEISSYSGRMAGVPLVGLAMHPSGERLVSAGFDRLVTVSQPPAGRQVLVLRELDSSCYAVAFSADGHRLAAASGSGKVHVWDGTPLAGTEDPCLQTFRYPGDEVWACDVAPNGLSIAAGGHHAPSPARPAAPVLVWNGLDAQAPTRLPGHAIVVFSLAFDPSGRFLASSGDQPMRPGMADVKVWDLEAGKEAFAVEAFEGEGRLFSVVFSRDARWLVAGGTDRKIKVWDAASGRKIGVAGEHAKEITALVFSPDGRYLASIGNDDVVKVWDARNLGEPQPNPRGFPGISVGFTDSLAFSATENRLAVVTDDDSVVVHDLEGGDRALRLSHPGHRPLALAFSPDGRWVASGGMDSTVRLWDARSGALRRTLRSHIDLIVRLRFSRLPEGTRLISASRDGTVKIWDMRSIEKQIDSQ